MTDYVRRPDEHFAGLAGFAFEPHYHRWQDLRVHFIWGCDDDVFTESWGRAWASRLNATFDGIAGAGHFLQNTHGREVAETLVARTGGA